MEEQVSGGGGGMTEGHRGSNNLPGLPNELLDNVLRFLDSKPPSQWSWTGHPTSGSWRCDLHPLKDASLVSTRLNQIVRPWLFRHARLNPRSLSEFLDCVDRIQGLRWIESLAVCLSGPPSSPELLHGVEPSWWHTLLGAVPNASVSIHCPPDQLPTLTQVSIDFGDAWAFRMPFHVLRFGHNQGRRFDAGSRRAEVASASSVLLARPWTSMCVNEGSNLAAYTRYEYFLKSPPSLFNALRLSQDAVWTTFWTNLKDFSFVAVFPFYNHVEHVLQCVGRMTSLETLFFKLCPDPGSVVLEDEISHARGLIDMNDAWSEFETSYNLIGGTVGALSTDRKLRTLIVDDVKVAGVRTTIEENLGRLLSDQWAYHGEGIWCRNDRIL